MSDFQTFAHVRKDACRVCGRPLTFCSQFKKAMGQHRVEVCEFCRTVRHNEDDPQPVEVGPAL